ncbi:MAG: hypothetical protein KDA77_07915, partial [Planctomycetaceae bacterium]|nr:hypothetical protein [Planctomycetaceae bacterium]
MFTTSSPHSPVTQKLSTLQVSLLPLTHKLAAVELTRGDYQIGSSAECSIRITDPGIAEQHVSIHVGTDEVILQAIDPRVWVNDRPIRQISLTAGMKFFVGPVGFLVDAITEVPVEAKREPARSASVSAASTGIEIPEELQAVAKVQHMLAERQKLLQKIEQEQLELQREMELQEAELHQLHERFAHEPEWLEAKNSESVPTQAPHNTQPTFDESILELDHKLQQLELLQQEISQEQQQLLSRQNQVNAQRHQLSRLEQSLRGEQAALSAQQQQLLHAWLDFEAQQTSTQAEQETEQAFLEESKTAQQLQLDAISQVEQSLQSFEQELTGECHRLESWAEDLETEQRSLQEQAAALAEQQQALET